jgi:hypothetical protein
VTVRNHVRTLARASLVTLALLIVPSGLVYAEPSATTKAECTRRGYYWSDTLKACADRPCLYAGQTYQPGETRNARIGGRIVTLMCDGFTGVMVQVRTQTPSGPAAPTMPGTASPF